MVFSPLLSEPLEFVHLRLRIAFWHIERLNPVDQKFLDLIFGKVWILLMDTLGGLLEIQPFCLRLEESASPGIEAHVFQQNLEYVGHVRP